MSETRNYFYLRLKENFFESDSMILLESMPEGYKYSNILLKLYLRSLKNGGKLMLNDKIPYNANMIASVTRHSIGDVEKAIKIFEQLNLIEMLDSGAIYITDIQSFIGKSTTEADRKRLYRERIEREKLQLPMSNGTNVPTNDGQLSDKTPPELDTDLELELKKEKELKLKLKKELKQKEDEEKISFAEFVTLTQTEYDTLIAELGNDQAVKDCIDILDNYKGSSGKKYKSDYRAIRSWVIDKYKSKQKNNSTAVSKSTQAAEEAIRMLKERDL